MIRNATMKDCDAILALVNQNAGRGLMLPKTPYAIYLAIPNFIVWEEKGQVVGCCRLAIVWQDMAEIASLAVQDDMRGRGIGHALVSESIRKAKELKLQTVFTLTYQVHFFESCGFTEVERKNLPYKVFGDCLNCPKVNCCDEHALIINVDE